MTILYRGEENKQPWKVSKDDSGLPRYIYKIQNSVLLRRVSMLNKSNYSNHNAFPKCVCRSFFKLRYFVIFMIYIITDIFRLSLFIVINHGDECLLVNRQILLDKHKMLYNRKLLSSIGEIDHVLSIHIC